MNINAQVQNGSIYPGVQAGTHVTRTNNNNMIQPSIEVGVNRHTTLGVFCSYNRFQPGVIAGFDAYGTKRGGGITASYYRYFNKRSKWGWYTNSTFGIYDNKVVNRHSGSSFLLNRHTSGELTLTPGVFFSAGQRLILFTNVGGIAVSGNKYRGADLRHNFLDQVSFGVRFSFGDKNPKSVRAQ